MNGSHKLQRPLVPLYINAVSAGETVVKSLNVFAFGFKRPDFQLTFSELMFCPAQTRRRALLSRGAA